MYSKHIRALVVLMSSLFLLAGTLNSQVAADFALHKSGGAVGPQIQRRAHLLGEYLLNEGVGVVANDSSGHGNNGMIQGSPSWIEGQGLNFTSSFQYIDLPQATNSVQTWQMAVYNPPYSAGASMIGEAPVYSGRSGNPSLLCGSTPAQPCFLQSSYITAASSRFFALTDHTEAEPFLTSGWHVVTFVCGTANNLAHIYYDAEEVSGYVNQGSNTCPASANGHLQIGGSTYYQAFWTGRIAAVWLWDVPLTKAEAKQSARAAQQVLLGKGIPLEYSHVQGSTPLVLAGLDSRTAGAGVGLTQQTMWPFEMQLSDPSYKVINVALGGQSVFDEVNQFNILYALQYQPNSIPVIIVLWGGVNDFNFQTAAQVAENLHEAVRKAKGAGARIVLATETSATGKDAIRDQLNVILREQALGWGADNLAELATDPVLGADGASTNTTYFGDGLHPTGAAEPRVTAIMQNVVNELLGSTEASPTQVSVASYQEQAGDDFVELLSSEKQTVRLPSCIGYSLPRAIHASAGGASVSTVPGQVLTGVGEILPGRNALFTPVPGPTSTAGCSWQRTYALSGNVLQDGRAVKRLTATPGSPLPLTVRFRYAGPVPTGAISLLVDGSAAELTGQACRLEAGQDQETCTINYVAPQTEGIHQFVFSQAADENYHSYSGQVEIVVASFSTGSF